jgi:hypothetical protein
MAVYVECNAMLACSNACDIAFMLAYFFRAQVILGISMKTKFSGGWESPFEDQVLSDLIGLLPLTKGMRVLYFFSGAVVFPEKPMRTFLTINGISHILTTWFF